MWSKQYQPSSGSASFTLKYKNPATLYLAEFRVSTLVKRAFAYNRVSNKHSQMISWLVKATKHGISKKPLCIKIAGWTVLLPWWSLWPVLLLQQSFFCGGLSVFCDGLFCCCLVCSFVVVVCFLGWSLSLWLSFFYAAMVFFVVVWSALFSVVVCFFLWGSVFLGGSLSFCRGGLFFCCVVYSFAAWLVLFPWCSVLLFWWWAFRPPVFFMIQTHLGPW